MDRLGPSPLQITSIVDASHRCGDGTTAKLWCPASSTDCTANITLSFDTGTVARVAFPTCCECSQFGALVARQTISYAVARPSAGGSQCSVDSFTSSFVSSFTFCGGPGADASAASVAAFTRATLAT